MTECKQMLQVGIFFFITISDDIIRWKKIVLPYNVEGGRCDSDVMGTELFVQNFATPQNIKIVALIKMFQAFLAKYFCGSERVF